MIKSGGCRFFKVELVAFFQARIRLFPVSATYRIGLEPLVSTATPSGKYIPPLTPKFGFKLVTRSCSAGVVDGCPSTRAGLLSRTICAPAAAAKVRARNE